MVTRTVLGGVEKYSTTLRLDFEIGDERDFINGIGRDMEWRGWASKVEVLVRIHGGV